LARRIQRGEGAQEGQRYVTGEPVKAVQRRRIVGLQTGRQLVHHPRLLPHQRVQIARQGFEFLHQRPIGSQDAQIRPIAAPFAREEQGIQRIGLDPRGRTHPVHRRRIDRIDDQPRFQERRDEEAMGRLHHTRQGLRLLAEAVQIGRQPVDPFRRVRHAYLADLLSRRAEDHDIMVLVRPINACKLHLPPPFRPRSCSG
jgi:hypothetical protein